MRRNAMAVQWRVAIGRYPRSNGSERVCDEMHETVKLPPSGERHKQLHELPSISLFVFLLPESLYRS